MKKKYAIQLMLFLALISANSIYRKALGTSDFNSQEEFLYLFLTIDVSKNGSAFVNCNMSGWIYHSFNLSIPKTVVNYIYHGDVAFIRFLETEVSYDYLEIGPTLKDKADISIDYFWPDCAVPFNNSYYLSCNEFLPLYPSRTRIEANVTVIFPPNSTLMNPSLNFPTNKTVSHRLHISFIKQGYEDMECHDYVPFLAFVQPEFQENTALRTDENIELSYPKALSKWASTVFVYSSLAYCKLSSLWSTRSGKEILTINLVPAICIEEATAFYDQQKDAICFPAYWTIGASYSLFRPLHVLFHEIGHSFTSFHLPTFLSEGLAEYTAFRLFDLMDMEENRRTMTSDYFLEDPLQDNLFNSSKFFRWKSKDFSYQNAFYVTYDLINSTGVSSFQIFLDLLDNTRVNFYKYQERDRYDLLTYYLNVASGKDITDFFRRYDHYVDPNRLSNLQAMSFMVFGFSVIFLATLSYSAVKWGRQKRIKRFLLSTVVISMMATLSALFFISSLSIEFFLSPCSFPIGLAILGVLVVTFVILHKLDFNRG